MDLYSIGPAEKALQKTITPEMNSKKSISTFWAVVLFTVVTAGIVTAVIYHTKSYKANKEH
jgi:hypothetical protein